MKISPEKAKFLIDVCFAISFIAVAAGKYFASFTDMPEQED